MSAFDFYFARGNEAEVAVANWLRSRGWYVIPTYALTPPHTEPPSLLGFNHSHVLPDLDCSKAGTRLWVEVKRKGAATLHRNTGHLEHGFGLRSYEAYCMVASITGCALWFAVLKDDGELLMGSEESLGQPRVYTGKEMDAGGMVFWRDTAFKSWGKI